MTAATTPRLGLMLPNSSDTFAIADFDSTFTKLDNTPGITPVANYAALPTNLTSSQHGSVYLQSDNGSLWMWNKPSSAAGAWKKINTVGMLGTAAQTATVSTASTSLPSGAVLVSLNYTAAGGRRVLAFFSIDQVYNNGSYGYSQVGMFLDGGSTSVETSIGSGGASGKSISHHMLQDCGSPAPGSSHSVTVKLASVASAGGGTSTTAALGQLYVWEI
jgi:hypothetical protein